LDLQAADRDSDHLDLLQADQAVKDQAEKADLQAAGEAERRQHHRLQVLHLHNPRLTAYMEVAEAELAVNLVLMQLHRLHSDIVCFVTFTSGHHGDQVSGHGLHSLAEVRQLDSAGQDAAGYTSEWTLARSVRFIAIKKAASGGFFICTWAAAELPMFDKTFFQRVSSFLIGSVRLQ
jgi:hypothetical protein